MTYHSVSLALALFVLGHASPIFAQSDELKLKPRQPKITTVSAMRARKAPQVTAEEIMRLKLGTVVNIGASSAHQDTIGGKTDHWYLVDLPNGQTGWVFGGLLRDYDAHKRDEIRREIIEASLQAENTDFSDRQEIYNLATIAINEAKDVNHRAEFELLKLLALARWAESFPDNMQDKSPYREWRKAHQKAVIANEFGGGYNLRSEVLWELENRYHTLPIADRIAWEAAQNPQPSDCEGDEVCHFFLREGEITYLSRHPNGAHAVEAINNLTAALTDDVIKRANAKGGDQYALEERVALRKLFTSLRAALAKTSAPEKTKLLEKLAKITPNR